jgi:hypothetical protein
MLLLLLAAAAAAAAAPPHIYSRASQTGRNSPVPHTCTGAATDVYNPLSLSTPTQERTSYYSLCSQLTDSRLPGHLNRQRGREPEGGYYHVRDDTHIAGLRVHDSVCVTMLHAHVCVVAWCAAPLTVCSAVQCRRNNGCRGQHFLCADWLPRTSHSLHFPLPPHVFIIGSIQSTQGNRIHLQRVLQCAS